jgi:orotidine-5'-phosphate decarboxylase
MQMSMIFVALDYSQPAEAWALVNKLMAYDVGYKVGLELFCSAGPELVRALADRGYKVFLDLKFKDIPNTVSRTVKSMAGLGAYMLNVHCSGGSSMMKAAAEAAAEHKAQTGCRPLVIGVTILTSLNDEQICDVSGPQFLNIQDKVERMARKAAVCGLDGVVCSPQEIQIVRQAVVYTPFKIISPGIRGADAPADDQKRTASAAEAVQAGADYLVIGRPITQAADPAAALQAFQNHISATAASI